MLLLQISDIHFRSPDCLDPDTDPEQAFRTRLIQDVGQRVGMLGSIDAVLISGDIAFHGREDEYAAAFAWIKRLAEAAGCGLERVFVVPETTM